MHTNRFWQSIGGALVLSLCAMMAHSQGTSVESGWLELVKGSRDDTMGAQLVNIEEGDSADTQKITLAIPKSTVANPDEIEEVLVVGQRLDKPEKSRPIKFTYEWISDYDNDNYGLVIRLGKDTNWPIRLYMNSESGFMQ
jgi:hypothetical protein